MQHGKAVVGILLANVLILAGCSEKASEGSSKSYTPDINPSAAPGVAFTYGYEFDVPQKSVSAVQEQHAAACEHLGPARCRITGMRYSVERNGSVYASLDVKLDREIARAFGRDGVSAVEKAGGKLTSASIEGEDVAPAIAVASQQSDDAAKRRDEITKRLAQPGLGDRERTELQTQANALQETEQQAKTDRSNSEARLAATPMTLRYNGVSGLALSDNPFADAAGATFDSTKAMVATVLLVLGYTLPWILLAISAIALWRTRPAKALRQFISRMPDHSAER